VRCVNGTYRDSNASMEVYDLIRDPRGLDTCNNAAKLRRDLGDGSAVWIGACLRLN
jgi:hypothetical protein